jgi:cytochrome d ubiquinol oxidase subunit II
MLVDQLTINAAAGAGATLIGLLIVVALAAVIVLPALSYLLWMTQTDRSSQISDGRQPGDASRGGSLPSASPEK